LHLITATAKVAEPGPLTQVVLKYREMIESRATGSGVSADDWEPLKEVVALDEFKRVGAYLEEMSWRQYIQFPTEWAGELSWRPLLGAWGLPIRFVR